jgi:hypothetical protein
MGTCVVLDAAAELVSCMSLGVLRFRGARAKGEDSSQRAAVAASRFLRVLCAGFTAIRVADCSTCTGCAWSASCLQGCVHTAAGDVWTCCSVVCTGKHAALHSMNSIYC